MKTLESDRPILRNFQASDAQALFHYPREPTAICLFSLKLDDLRAAEEEAVSTGGDKYIAVCLKDTGQIVGDLFVHSDPKWHDDQNGTTGSDSARSLACASKDFRKCVTFHNDSTGCFGRTILTSRSARNLHHSSMIAPHRPDD